MFHRGFIVAVIFLMLPITVYSAGDCPPPGYTTEQLQQLKQSGFEIDGPEQRNSLAVALLGCVAEPNPAIRDGIAFEGLSAWLRAKSLSPETVDTLRVSLLEQIQ